MSDFSNQTILVTGASSGIGLASAQAYLDKNAKRVYIVGRNAQKLELAQAQLGERAIALVADVGNLAQLEQMARKIRHNGDTLDVLFANAGIAENNLIGSTTEAAFDAIFDTNVKGVFFTVQSLLPLMKLGGNIVLNASVAAHKGMQNLSLYSASKAAVRSFARTWCNDLKAQKIRVNTISPGVTLTPILQTGLKMTEQQIADFSRYLQDVVPLGRMADPTEIAAAVLFLSSSAASFVNGVELSVDGGMTQI
ncbi:SDR family oxidoreductase [Undibacterium sp. Ren11W]|uniref:SDR family oxidoreductase n=1 Tax=Undibacterium sp. Ren11W TaxID=3413045 RepID=UPI003BF1A7B9